MIRKRCMSGLANMRDILRTQLSAIQEAGTWKTENVITSPQSNVITVEGSDNKLLNFCANNYLGLSVSKIVIIQPLGLNFLFSAVKTEILQVILSLGKNSSILMEI